MLVLAVLFFKLVWGGSIVSTVDVFTSGKEGYDCYRIPAIVRNPNNGYLLAFAEGRKYSCSDHGYVDIVMKRSVDNGSTWSSLSIVYHYESQYWTTVGNPVPIYDTYGILDVSSSDTVPVVLVFCINNTRIFYTVSSDDGKTWTTPIEITSSVKLKEWDSWYATGPAGGITVKVDSNNARFLVPCDHGPASSENTETKSHIIYSDDGVNWKIGAIDPTLTTNECSLAQLPNGTLILSTRNSLGDKLRAFSYSNDLGMTLSQAVENQDLPDPTCEAAIIYHESSSSLLFSNPSDKKSRKNMCIHQSSDAGETWKNVLTVFKGSSEYSSLVDLMDGNIGLVYEKGDLLDGLQKSFKYLEFVKFVV